VVLAIVAAVAWDGETMSAEETIYQAAEDAIREGMSPRDFVKIASQAWSITLHDKARYAAKDFEVLLRTPLGNGPA
jgi:hypothetical protein